MATYAIRWRNRYAALRPLPARVGFVIRCALRRPRIRRANTR